MTTASIYHFFARIALRRGYFRTVSSLSGFEFPRNIAIAGSSAGFPDFVLRTNAPNSEFTGGEMIELKDSTTYSISSFNSTIPSEVKSVSVLTRALREKTSPSGELPNRRVYYLIRGRDMRAEPAPKAKVCLVSGKFFETIPVSELLPAAFRRVAHDSSAGEVEIPDEYLRLFRNQEDFASSRQVEGASVKIRFRVMADAHPTANLLREANYPMIKDNTLSFLEPDEDLSHVDIEERQFSWSSCPASLRCTEAFKNLSIAIDEIDSSLKTDVLLSKLQHPLNGPFFLAQFSL